MLEVNLTVPPELTGYTAVLQSILSQIAEEVYNEISRLAGQELNTTGEDYLQGLQPVRHYPIKGTSGVYATIELVGDLPNMIEHGWSGGDMKPFLLNGRNAKIGKDGVRYNIVPFRHGSPGTTGRNFQAMGSGYRQRQVGVGGMSRTGHLSANQAIALGARVYKAAKQLKPGERLPAGTGGAGLLKPHHKTDIYAGMQRDRANYGGGATQSKYSTFRAVSDNSDPAAWIHLWIEPRKFFEKAARYADQVANFAIAQAIAGLHKAGSGGKP
jgi:hypothetical protein